MIVHYDLFSGIGGFSLAIDNVYGKSNTRHIFIERDEFCQLVLRKHWPEAEYHSCINEFITHAKSSYDRRNPREFPQKNELEEKKRSEKWVSQFSSANSILLTGGFPCQPFSTAGQRKGTADDRYLWPAMFESIRLIQPDWIIAENVAGLVSWSEGLVLEQVCSDLESEDYEVQPFIIPACAINAPHRRDRVWIIANRKSGRQWSCESEGSGRGKSEEEARNGDRNGWNQNWLEVATRFCGVDDGIPRRLDRSVRLKALGNAIVPQVAEEIFSKMQLNSQGTLWSVKAAIAE